MSKGTPTNPHSGNGGGPPTGSTAACCGDRHGDEEVTGNFQRMFQQYGRSTSWFTSRPSNAANLPSGVTWERFYYRDSYKYRLSYQTDTCSATRVNGTIKIKLRARATVQATPANLIAAAPSLFTTVTAADITAAFGPWDQAIQNHWTRRNYTVELGAPQCPGTYRIEFSIEESSSSQHIDFTVLNMREVSHDPAMSAALSNPADPKHATAQSLSREWRSNAAKFNLGDSRGTLVFAHEYGHWMGWGDEYIEISGSTAHPAGGTGSVLVETRGSNNVSLRVAIRIKNPTERWKSAHGTTQQDIDITTSGAQNWLMSSMQSPQTHMPRFVYTIVDDFIRIYNDNHYGGGTQAYCIDVTCTP